MWHKQGRTYLSRNMTEIVLCKRKFFDPGETLRDTLIWAKPSVQFSSWSEAKVHAWLTCVRQPWVLPIFYSMLTSLATRGSTRRLESLGTFCRSRFCFKRAWNLSFHSEIARQFDGREVLRHCHVIRWKKRSLIDRWQGLTSRKQKRRSPHAITAY